jgi:Ran GTPase-activating protein 1
MPSDIDQVASMMSKSSVEDVKLVSFAGRKLKVDTADDAKEIVDAIKSTVDITALRLEGNTIGLEAAIEIAEALKDQGKFEKALWSDIFTGRLRSEIPPSLEHLGDGIIAAGAKLSELDLSDNAFGPDGVKGIKKLLMSESCYKLNVLKLNNNGLGVGGGKLLSEAFIKCHESSSLTGSPFALKVFISGRNRLEDEGAKALSKAFKILGSLEEITMPQNGIRPDGVGALAEAFLENKNLKIININDNTCTESGAKAIGKCLPSLRKLETLNVGDCLLKNSGALALAPELAVDMPNLKEVIMSFNEIRIEGALALTRSMKNKNSLSVLNLDGNQLGDQTEDIQELMSSFGRIDALAPFDDNEDPDSEEEDDDDEEDDSTNNNHDNSADDISLHIKGMGLTTDSPLLKDTDTNDEARPSTVDDIRSFFSCPTYESWEKINKLQRKELLKTVIKEDLIPYPDKLCHAYVHACSAVEGDNVAIEELADTILQPAFTDTSIVLESMVSTLLIYLGLLKAELKVERVDSLKGPLQGLQSIIMKEYFPRTLTTHFIAFLMKPNRLLDACPTERHNLLAKLHQK